MTTPNFLLPTETQIPDDWYFERLRIWRDNELFKSDWTQVEDAPVDKAVWAEYRQALRDLPNQSNNPSDLVFPVKP